MRVFAEIMRGAMNMPGSAGGGNSGSFSGCGGFSGGAGSGYSGGSHGGAMPHNTVNGTNDADGAEAFLSDRFCSSFFLRCLRTVFRAESSVL